MKTKKVVIGYRTYSLTENPIVLDELNYIGRHHGTRQQIEYVSDVAPSELANTIIHEILHACWDLHLAESELEEEIVEKLSHGFTQVMRDNPKLIDELQDML